MRNLLNIILFISLLSSEELLIIDDFESGNFESLEWSFEGDLGWVIDSLGAYDSLSAHSDTTLTHNQSSILTLVVDTGCRGDSEIKFYRKVSTEEDYDYLIFYINNVIQDEWAGIHDWEQLTYQLPEGQSILKWEYLALIYPVM